MYKSNHKIWKIILVLIFIFSSKNIYADSLKSFETLSTAINFMKNGPSGQVTMDILTNADNPDSVAQADEILKILGSGVGSKVTLTGTRIDDPSALSSKVIFLTQGTKPYYDAAKSSAKNNGSILVSTDPSCMKAGCVLLIEATPTIRITLDVDLASAFNISFATAFDLMITKK